MIQCPAGHLFCMKCMVRYSSILLGEQDYRILCMDQSGCRTPFLEDQLKHFLTPQLLSLYWKLRQTTDVKMAGLEGLQECPHCDFMIVIDDPGEKVFRCQNEKCGAETCIGCKTRVRMLKFDPQR